MQKWAAEQGERREGSRTIRWRMEHGTGGEELGAMVENKARGVKKEEEVLKI
jgi:hypothetical protein